MKLKEWVAEEYEKKTHRKKWEPALDYENDHYGWVMEESAREAFIAGFEKAREMAAKIARTESVYSATDIEALGEEEMTEHPWDAGGVEI